MASDDHVHPPNRQSKKLRWWTNGAWCHAVHVLQNFVPSYHLSHAKISLYLATDMNTESSEKKSWTWGAGVFFFPFSRTTKISGKQTTTGAPDNKHTNLQEAGWAGASEFYPGQQDSDSIIPLLESKQEMLIPAEQNSTALNNTIIHPSNPMFPYQRKVESPDGSPLRGTAHGKE